MKKNKIMSKEQRIKISKTRIRKKLGQGKNNPNWKGGVMYDKKRKLIYSPNHPNPDFLHKYCYEYKLIMEKYLGRKLKKGEIIHHKNGDVTDNKIKNLQVMTQSEHIKLHQKQGDMKQIFKSKFDFSYNDEQEYKKEYGKLYYQKNKEKLKKYRQNYYKKLK